jgi:hypothetical protein
MGRTTASKTAGIEAAAPRLTITDFAHKAGVVPNALVATGVALLDMAAECRRPALHDRGHGPALCRRQRSAVLLTIGIAEAAEHLRHFGRRAAHPHRG